jgi:hypothetical protein
MKLRLAAPAGRNGPEGSRGHSPALGRSAGGNSRVTPNPANRPLWRTKVPIERGELATIDAVARYIEALGGRLDLIASFGDHTLIVTTTEAA